MLILLDEMTKPAWQGASIVFLAGVVYDVLLSTVRRVDRTHPDTPPTLVADGPDDPNRWLGYARDASNLLGFLLFLLGFWSLGFPLPLALLATSLWTLGFYGLDYFLARTLRLRRPHLAFLVVLAVLAAAVAALREPIASLLAGLVVRLFS